MADALPMIAERVWRDRQAIAGDLVARGKWDRADADRRLMFFAIPCLLLGAEVTAFPFDLRDELDALRQGTRYPGGDSFTRSEAETRELFAATRTGAHSWRRELAEALCRAALHCLRDPGEEPCLRHDDLHALCAALNITVAAPVPAEPERKAA